jgi:hypothetical protein
MHSLLYYGFNYGRKKFYDTGPRDLYYKPFYSCNKLACALKIWFNDNLFLDINLNIATILDGVK